MGMFDSVYHKLKCPVTGTTREREIQIKWDINALKEYRVGDQTRFGENRRNIRIRNSYSCEDCRTRAFSYCGDDRIPRADNESDLKERPYQLGGLPAHWHPVFINLQRGKITEVITADESKSRELQAFLDFDYSKQANSPSPSANRQQFQS